MVGHRGHILSCILSGNQSTERCAFVGTHSKGPGAMVEMGRDRVTKSLGRSRGMDHDSACRVCENCLFLLRCRSRACGGLLDQRSDSIGCETYTAWLPLDLDHRGARPFDMARARQVGSPCLGGDEIPARLGSPRWCANLPLRAATPHGTWSPAMNALFRSRLRRKWRETLLVEEQKAVLRRQYRRPAPLVASLS